MKKMLFFGIIFFSIFLFGCTKVEGPIGGQTDEYGCLTPAGYTWDENVSACIRPWELDESQKKAAWIAVAPLSYRPITITKVETLRCEGCFNVYFNAGPQGNPTLVRLVGWKPSFEGEEHYCTDDEKSNAACTKEYMPVCAKLVLNTGELSYVTAGNACTACAMMKSISYTQGECETEAVVKGCSDEEGSTLSYEDAYEIARASECGPYLKEGCGCPEGYRLEGEACNPECYYSQPRCMMPSIECAMPYMCNSETSTLWIGMTLKKEGCSPACVVNIKDRNAEINYRCTGLKTD